MTARDQRRRGALVPAVVPIDPPRAAQDGALSGKGQRSGSAADGSHTPPTDPDTAPVKRGRDGRRMNAKSLANLRPGAGAWKAEQPGPALKHGLHSRRPGAVLLGDVAVEVVDALAATVALRGPDGDVDPRFVPAVEAAALQLLIVRRVLGYLATRGYEDSRGRLRPEVEGLQRAVERLRKHLDGLGATPAAFGRLGLDTAQTFDLARHWAEQDEDERARNVDVIEEEAGDGTA